MPSLPRAALALAAAVLMATAAGHAREFKTLREVVKDFRNLTGSLIVIQLKPAADAPSGEVIVLVDGEGSRIRAEVPSPLKKEVAEMKSDRFYTLVIFLRHLGADGVPEGLIAEKAD